MNLHTLMTVGVLGLSSTGFGGAGPIPIGTGVGSPIYGEFNSPMVWSQPAEPQAPATTTNIPIFKPSDFPFVIIVPDDGKDPSGGWQAAKVNLEFFLVRLIPPGVISWKCPITIQIPIRHSTRGYISPSSAASMSTLVTNAVTVGMDFQLPQGIFCRSFVTGVQTAFPIVYPNLGARVTL